MPQATIAIVTLNRKHSAKAAVESALSQEGDNEVLLVDDGSTDGTSDYIRQLFPQVRVHRYEENGGLVLRRTQAGQLASAPFIFSIDDDALYADPNVVRDTLRYFQSPRIGAVAIPHANLSPQNEVMWASPTAPEDGKIHVTNAFIGCAFALRRDLFNSLGGFLGYLFRHGEETEYCQRMVDAGYLIAVGGPLHRVRHYHTTAYSRKGGRYIYRSRTLTIWRNAPLSLLVPLMLFNAARAVKETISARQLVLLEGLFCGLGAIVRRPGIRHPVRLRSYRMWLELRKARMMTIEEVVSRYPDLFATAPDATAVADLR